jgi:hypothetical protein
LHYRIGVINSHASETLHGEELKKMSGTVNLEDVDVTIFVGCKDDFVVITGVEYISGFNRFELSEGTLPVKVVDVEGKWGRSWVF